MSSKLFEIVVDIFLVGLIIFGAVALCGALVTLGPLGGFIGIVAGGVALKKAGEKGDS